MSFSEESATRRSVAEFDSKSKPYHVPNNNMPDNVAAEKPQQIAHQFQEGGTKAWLVVFGCWCVSFASFGYINSFGFVLNATRAQPFRLTGLPRVYETYDPQPFLSNRSPSDVAWIGSTQAFAQFSATLISGLVTDRYGAMIRSRNPPLRLYIGQTRLMSSELSS